MDVGMEHEGTSLKIGYLNFNFDELLPKYLESYDIVIRDSQSMQLALEIFHACAKVHPQSETNLQELCHLAEQTEQGSQSDEEIANVIA